MTKPLPLEDKVTLEPGDDRLECTRRNDLLAWIMGRWWHLELNYEAAERRSLEKRWGHTALEVLVETSCPVDTWGEPSSSQGD